MLSSILVQELCAARLLFVLKLLSYKLEHRYHVSESLRAQTEVIQLHSDFVVLSLL